MAKLKITIEDTPNPHAMKFTLNRELTDGDIRSFPDPAAAGNDPLATALFGLPGVTNVMYVNDFVTVNKKPSVRWAKLKKQVKEVLQSNLR